LPAFFNRSGSDGGEQWLFFNDEKVALSEAPPLDLGYIYVFARED
jgi:uncharacterized UBP type Zn finger protein